MATTSDIRNGMCLELNHDTFTIVEFQHVKPGKGAAFVRTKIKSLTTGRVLDHTFSAGHKVDEVRVERRKFQYLYSDDMGYNFMNTDDYEQLALPEALIDRTDLLKEGMEVEVLYHAVKNIPLTLDMPPSVVMAVTYTEPGMKGDTATNTLKPATVESGAEIRVPLFVNEGDRIRIDTRTGAYMERVKE
jgi:elongation factor P